MSQQLLRDGPAGRHARDRSLGTQGKLLRNRQGKILELCRRRSCHHFRRSRPYA
eukprot:COSAG02_NODE_19638_length_872_cov_0.545925_2_plen_53_part_01